MSKMLKAIVLVAALTALGTRAEVLEDVRDSVKGKWKKLTRESAEICGLREQMRDLPDSSWWFLTTDKKDQRKKIRKLLLEVRELLLSTNARKILASVDALDRDLAALDEDVRTLREELMLDPAARADIEAKLAKLAAKRTALEAKRRAAAEKVREELRALGLTVGGTAAENCLFTVNFGEIVDGVIVARNIAAVVENLRTLMDAGDVVAARRYFGMYLVMVDVQVVCFEDYLEKSREGEWRQGINRILAQAQAARDGARKNARNAAFTADQRQIFARNAEVNEKTVRAAQAYAGVLDAHEAVIARKLKEAQKVREVVASSYETVNLAGDFIQLAKTNQASFDALLQLDLPPLNVFDDAAVQREFQSINQKLKE